MWNTSLWWYKPGEFRQLINVISDKSILVSESLANFREVSQLPRKFKQMTIQEVSVSLDAILELLNSRINMPAETKFKLGCKKAYRRKQLIDTLAEIYEIDVNEAKAEVVLGCYSDHIQTYPYALEVVIAPRSDLDDYHAGEVEIIDSVNDNASSDGGGAYFYGGFYHWKDKKRNRYTQDYSYLYASSIQEILSECGFNSSDSFTKRKKPCILYMNLRSPCIEWLGAKGKTQINTRPYSKDISETVSKLAYMMPSYHGEGHGRTYTPTLKEKKTAIEYLVNFLHERKEVIGSNPNLIAIDRLTQSTVWYRIRPVMMVDYEEGRFKPKKSWGDTRRYLTSIIDDLCQGELLYQGEEIFPGQSVSREDLGIFAAAKGMMLYKGESYPVSIDNIKKIADKGIAVWAVEKEGIPNIIAPFTAEYGIALVTSGGRFTKYIKQLIEKVKEIGSVPQIVVDYDAVGDDIARSTYTPTAKIGVYRDIVPWLQANGYPDLTEDDIEESYTPPKGIAIYDEYLKDHRIELDSIIAKTSGEALFKYLLYKSKLPEFSPDGFNINKITTIPDNTAFYSKVVQVALFKYDRAKDSVVRKLNSLIDDRLDKEISEIEKENEAVRELKPISDKNKEIKDRLTEKVTDDEEIETESKNAVDLINDLISKIESNNTDGIHVDSQDKSMKKG